MIGLKNIFDLLNIVFIDVLNESGVYVICLLYVEIIFVGFLSYLIGWDYWGI